MNSILRLVNFETSDKLSLPGLLYEPEKKTDRVLIYLHGNGSSSVFYGADKVNLFGEQFTKVGIAFFPFNNRGAHWIKKLDKKVGKKEERVLYGMVYELIKECIYDIDSAVFFLKKLGYKTFYLAGISTGANKIVVYHYYKRKNPIRKYILLSGGDDTGLYFDMEFDEYCYGKVPECIDILKKETTKPEFFTFKIIKDADHGFSGKEEQLMKIIIDWLSC